MLALQRRAREILLAGRHRLPRLTVQLPGLLAQRLLLQLQALLRGDDVRDPLLDVLQILELSLVGVIERLGRILGTIQQPRDLRLDVRHDPASQSRHHTLRRIWELTSVAAPHSALPLRRSTGSWPQDEEPPRPARDRRRAGRRAPGPASARPDSS